MSTSRFLGLLAVLMLAVVVVLTVYAKNAVSSPQAALDQSDRHPDFINLSAVATTDQARLEYRRGEWNAAPNLDAETARWVAMGKFYAKLEAQRIQRSQEAETARWQALGEYYAKQVAGPAEFDVEQARVQWRAGE